MCSAKFVLTHDESEKQGALYRTVHIRRGQSIFRPTLAVVQSRQQQQQQSKQWQDRQWGLDSLHL